jgi:TatD DNase family protein
MAELIDSHAHLDDVEDLDGVVGRLQAAGVSRVVLVGCWRAPGDFGDALALARARPELFSAAVGFHPHEAAKVPEEDWATAAALARDPGVVAFGEIGLDFHYDFSPRPDQERVFRRSLALARAAAKPIVIHVREADAECLRILRDEGVPDAGGVVHCFTGDAPAAEAYVALGLYVSFSGIVTFKNAEPIRQAVQVVPRDRLLVETDSPYLAPVPFRGKRNEPAHVVHVAAKIAELWGSAPDEVARVTAENARRLFALPR